jgi:hypothetical protein
MRRRIQVEWGDLYTLLHSEALEIQRLLELTKGDRDFAQKWVKPRIKSFRKLWNKLGCSGQAEILVPENLRGRIANIRIERRSA